MRQRRVGPVPQRTIYGMRKTLPAVAIVLCTVVSGVLLARGRGSDEPYTNSFVCAADDYPCLKRQYEEAVSNGLTADVVSGLLNETTSTAGCHEAAHIAGRAIGRLDPDTALSLNTPELDARCDYGYLHGVFQGLAAINRDPTLAAIQHCAERASEVERDECFHAAGHGAAIVNDGIVSALSACEKLGGAAAESCAGGVYMEHVSSYLTVSTRVDGYGPRPVSQQEAEVMCSDAPERLMYACARKAALFWGPTLAGADLRDRCTKLAERASNGIRAVRACGAGVGEWLRNQRGWNIPETALEAESLDGQIAETCISSVGALDDLMLAACVDGVLTAILPGQVASGVESAAWIDPCPLLQAGGLTVAARECAALRVDLTGAAS